MCRPIPPPGSPLRCRARGSPTPTRAGLSHMADEVEKIVFVPSGTEKFSPQRSLGVWVMSCNIECKSPQDGEGCGGVVFAVSRRVFVERDIQSPMQAILDVPVAAADGKQSFWAHFLGEKKVALERLLPAALTDDTANRG